ncbi:MAG: hypothetical protein ACI83O_000709 [Patescibacteria group bacterium]|jgi:hypothetical protein
MYTKPIIYQPGVESFRVNSTSNIRNIERLLQGQMSIVQHYKPEDLARIEEIIKTDEESGVHTSQVDYGQNKRSRLIFKIGKFETNYLGGNGEIYADIVKGYEESDQLQDLIAAKSPITLKNFRESICPTQIKSLGIPLTVRQSERRNEENYLELDVRVKKDNYQLAIISQAFENILS